MIVCILGHASLVLVGALLCWAAWATEWSPLFFGGLSLGLLVFVLDLPVFWIASWFMSPPTFAEVFHAFFGDSELLSVALTVLALGSIQWALIGMLFAVPDLLNEPKRSRSCDV
jgi:hypothetical protein